MVCASSQQYLPLTIDEKRATDNKILKKMPQNNYMLSTKTERCNMKRVLGVVGQTLL